MVLAEDLYEIVENIGDLTVDDVRRLLDISEQSEEEITENKINTENKTNNKEYHNKYPQHQEEEEEEEEEDPVLAAAETEAIDRVTAATRAVAGMVAGVISADEATASVIEAARAVAALCEADPDPDSNTHSVTREVQDRTK